MEIRIKKSTLKYSIITAFSLFGIIFLLNNVISLSSAGNGTMNVWAVFLTGLFTGGLTCLAVQGGLLAATIAQREEARLKEKIQETGNALPILSFLGAKLFSYTLLGLLLGWLGSLVTLSLHAQVVMQFAVAIFMIGTALNILEVHPIFRYFAIQPPRFLTRLVRKQSKHNDIFAPALLGALTIFIPCGTTQAMMALAIATGNPLSGAAVLFAFVLGTSPLFFILGYFATKLGDTMQRKFMRFAAVAILLLAVFNLNNALALSGNSITLGASSSPKTADTTTVETATTNPTITIGSSGYSPTQLTIKAGTQIKLHLTNTGGVGCTQTFTIPKLGIQQSVPTGTQSDITFTAPTEPGELPFMCSMGMYRGVMNVI